MLKKILPAFAVMALLAGCSSLKPTFTNSKQASTSGNETKNEIKFLDITSDDNDKDTKSTIKEEHTSGPNPVASNESHLNTKSSENTASSALRLKYSQLLNTDPTQI